MLTGGVGIGFWCGRMEQSQCPAHHHRIFTVGIIGLALEQGMILLDPRFEYE